MCDTEVVAKHVYSLDLSFRVTYVNIKFNRLKRIYKYNLGILLCVCSLHQQGFNVTWLNTDIGLVLNCVIQWVLTYNVN